MEKSIINASEFASEFKNVMTAKGFKDWYNEDSCFCTVLPNQLYIDLTYDFLTIGKTDYIIADANGDIRFFLISHSEEESTLENHLYYEGDMEEFCNQVIDCITSATYYDEEGNSIDYKG